MPHTVSYRVYYEDTDAQGVVYYANYLKYLERGRTEFFRDRGVSVNDLAAGGIRVVVHHLDITFRRPALLTDLVDVVTQFQVVSTYRGRFDQRVERAGDLLVDAKVDVVCLDDAGGLTEFTPALREVSG